VILIFDYNTYIRKRHLYLNYYFFFQLQVRLFHYHPPSTRLTFSPGRGNYFVVCNFMSFTPWLGTFAWVTFPQEYLFPYINFLPEIFDLYGISIPIPYLIITVNLHISVVSFYYFRWFKGIFSTLAILCHQRAQWLEYDENSTQVAFSSACTLTVSHCILNIISRWF
jgi:hypothetical protein